MLREGLTVVLLIVLLCGWLSHADAKGRPRLTPVPHLDLLYAPDVSYELFYHQRTWFFRYEGKWFASEYHRGPWVFRPEDQVPEILKAIPKEFRDQRYEIQSRHRGKRTR